LRGFPLEKQALADEYIIEAAKTQSPAATGNLLNAPSARFAFGSGIQAEIAAYDRRKHVCAIDRNGALFKLGRQRRPACRRIGLACRRWRPACRRWRPAKAC